MLMAFWVIVDDSVGLDELLAGAGAAALGAFLAEAATHQSADRFRLRAGWLVPAVRLPGRLIGDTAAVFAALWRRLTRGEEPRSGFLAEPVRYGPQTAEGRTRRALLVGAESLAPNKFVLGIHADRGGVMVVHKLVLSEREAAE